MNIAASALSSEASYKLLVGIVVPRPIAWITTRSASGCVNAAPFSCFTFVSHDPPMVGVNIGRRAGAMKDTERNIREQGEFVVNIADDSSIDVLHRSSYDFPPDVSEVASLNLVILSSDDIAAPRLACAPVSMECVLDQIFEFGALKQQFVIGRVVRFHIDDRIYRDGKVDTARLKPIARLGGPNYARLGEIVTVQPSAAASPA
jgi:flavin reductase (DIM6/NTAB) family NADH-FMN oxidoreductase RutF